MVSKGVFSIRGMGLTDITLVSGPLYGSMPTVWEATANVLVIIPQSRRVRRHGWIHRKQTFNHETWCFWTNNCLRAKNVDGFRLFWTLYSDQNLTFCHLHGSVSKLRMINGSVYGHHRLGPSSQNKDIVFQVLLSGDNTKWIKMYAILIYGGIFDGTMFWRWQTCFVVFSSMCNCCSQ